MKYLLLFLLFASSTCYAKEYTFTFNHKDGRQFKVKLEAKNKNKALEDAGVYCGEFFGIGRIDLTEKEVDDIVDACTNPSLD